MGSLFGYLEKHKSFDVIGAEENISRFILESSKYRKSDHTVKSRAFLPNKNGETSVYRISNLTEVAVWGIGDEYVSKNHPDKKPILGRGDLLASTIFKLGLALYPEKTVHELHANIVDWPSEKDEKMDLAIELAREINCKLILKN